MYFKLFGFLILSPIAFNAAAQNGFPAGNIDFTNRKMQELAQKYIGHNVFTMPFLGLVKLVKGEPGIQIDTTIAHTDTSSFYLRASHKAFNPFRAPMDSVKTILAEIVEKESTTKEVRDTIFYLQTVGIAVGKAQTESLRALFRKTDKEIRPAFNYSNYRKTKTNKEITEELINYYYLGHPMPLMSIGWKKRSENEGTLVITFMVHLVNYPPDRM